MGGPTVVSRSRIPALDALRGIAVLLVLAYHLTRLEWVEGPLVAWAGLTRIGWSGVDLFFTLSGFLITGILLDARAATGATVRRYFGHFYARRARRIFPLYFLALAVLLYVVPRFGETAAATSAGLRDDARWHWTYLSNWLWLPGMGRAPAPTSAHFWSLAIEEQFYLVWPLVVWCVPLHRLAWVCGGVAVGSMLARCALLVAGLAPAVGYHLTMTRLDALALGGLVAVLLRIPAGRAWLAARWSAHWRLATFVAIALLAMTGGRRYAALMTSVGYTLIAVTVALLLAMVVLHPDARTVRWLAGARTLRWFGTISYGLYVVHYVVRGLLEAHGWTVRAFAQAWGSALLAQLAFYLVAGGVSVAVAAASWRWLERPILEGRALRREAALARAA